MGRYGCRKDKGVDGEKDKRWMNKTTDTDKRCEYGSINGAMDGWMGGDE